MKVPVSTQYRYAKWTACRKMLIPIENTPDYRQLSLNGFWGQASRRFKVGDWLPVDSGEEPQLDEVHSPLT
jgi:hypothetical protein